MLTVPTANTAQSEVLGLIGSQTIATQQLSLLASHIVQIGRNAELQVLGRGKADLAARLEPGSWCVAECLDHLTQTTTLLIPPIADAIRNAPKLNANRPLRSGIVADFLIRTLNPPYRIRFNVLPQLAPQCSDAETACASFVQSQSKLFTLVLSATGLAIDKVRIKSPVYARITYNIYGAFRMLVAHQNRHVWQIEQILRTLDARQRSGIA